MDALSVKIFFVFVFFVQNPLPWVVGVNQCNEFF